MEKGFQETKTSAMEEFVDTEETPHPVVHRTSAAGHYGMRDGHVQVVGTTRRIPRSHQIPTILHIGASVDFRLQARVS